MMLIRCFVVTLSSLILFLTSPGSAQDNAYLRPDNVDRLKLYNAIPAAESAYEENAEFTTYRYSANNQAIMLDGSGLLTDLLFWDTIQNKYYLSDAYHVGASPSGKWLMPSKFSPEWRETLLLNTHTDNIISLFRDRLAEVWFYDEEQYAVTFSGDGLLQLWDLESATQLAAKNADLRFPDIPFRGGLTNYPTELYVNYLRNPQTDDLYVPNVFEDYITSLEWHDNILLTLTHHGTLQSWDMQSQTMLASTQLCFKHSFQWNRRKVFDLRPSKFTPEQLFVEVQQRLNENCFAAVELDTEGRITVLNQLHCQDCYNTTLTLSADERYLGVLHDSGAVIYDTHTMEALSSVPLNKARVIRDIIFSDDQHLIITDSRQDENCCVNLWSWQGDDNWTLLHTLPGNNPLLSSDETSITVDYVVPFRFQRLTRNLRMKLQYRLPTTPGESPLFWLPGEIIPNAGINVYTGPSAETDVVKVLSGYAWAIARSGDFIYLPAHEGWVRSDPSYFQITDQLHIDELVEISDESFEAGLPQQIPVNFTSQEARDTETIWHSPVDYVLSSVESLSSPEGVSAIEVENFEEIELLDVLTVEGQDPYLRFSDDGSILQFWRLSQTSAPLLAWDLHRLEAAEALDSRMNEDDVDAEDPLSRLTLDGRLRISYSGTGTIIQVHDAHTGMLETEWQLESDQLPRYFYMFFSPNNRLVGFRGEERIQVYDLQTYERLGSLKVYLPYVDRRYGPIYSFEDMTGFSPDSRWLVGINSDELYLWDIVIGERKLALPAEPAYGYNFNANGDLMTFGDSSGAMLVNLETLDVYRLFENIRIEPPLRFTPDGTALIFGIQTVSSQSNYSSFLIAGIPSVLRPSWNGFEGHIVPESVSLRGSPSLNAEIVGTISGDVQVIAQSDKGDYYLLENGTWVRADPIYVELPQVLRDALPIWIEITPQLSGG